MSTIIERFRLDGRTALVTGAGQGIGRGYALALAEVGADVAVADINEDTARQTASDIRDLGRRSLAIVADVTASADVDRMVDRVVGEWGQLDIGVNNAGGGLLMNFEDYAEADWEAQMALNLKSVVLSARAEGRAMLPRKRGKIISTASMSGLIVNRGSNHAAYNTAKAGIIHLTRCLAVEWAPHGIQVNAISPGNILTPATKGPDMTHMHEAWIDMNPSGRLGEVQDLLGAVVYLASDASNYTTGHNLVVDGGFTLW